MFESTAPFALFDYFRVPYNVAESRREDVPGTARLVAREGAATLWWPTRGDLPSALDHRGSFVLNSTPLFGRVVAEAQMRAWLHRNGRSWRKAHLLRTAEGKEVSAVWKRDDGSVFLPFDPAEVIENFWTERYQRLLDSPARARASAFARRGYYRTRHLVPRDLQMSLRRSFSRLQAKAQFPRWPIEPALHDLYRFLFGLVADLAGRPIPLIAAWPKGHSWALVLTHDVEKRVGYANLGRLLQVELDAGYRSSWNFVPQRDYDVESDILEKLRDMGFEIGVHGLLHDGRDVSSAAMLRRRLPLIRLYADRWQATGFRSPATLRSAELMPRMGFDYDSSYSDTAPFEPQPGGCCTWLPYMLEDLVELPITLPQDHTIFELLGHRDETMWLQKARFLREHGGMALVLTHPDYLGNPHLLPSYQRLLEEFRSDSSAWKALPSDVSSWWRRRSQSRLEQVDGEWQVVGPVRGEAAVEFAPAPDAPLPRADAQRRGAAQAARL
jgi:hypothetical protein